jgi:apolipoprotein N-acyltransferase
MGALTPGQTLIVGGYRLAPAPRGLLKAFNSVMSVRRTAGDLVIDTTYDKHRLVPFGEYMPLDGVASRLGIKQMVHVGDGFDAGPPPAPIAPPGLPPVQPLICYESLFPGFTRDGAKATGHRPAWIVNVSNDAWFGASSGPWQHLNIASYRAIEEGLPMVRATPTGVSAVIDAYGRVGKGQQLGHGVYGVIDAPLPPALSPTLFDRLGDGPLWLLLAVSLGGARLPRRATLRRKGATPC